MWCVKCLVWNLMLAPEHKNAWQGKWLRYGLNIDRIWVYKLNQCVRKSDGNKSRSLAVLSSFSAERSDKRYGLSSGSQLEDLKEEHAFLKVLQRKRFGPWFLSHCTWLCKEAWEQGTGTLRETIVIKCNRENRKAKFCGHIGLCFGRLVTLSRRPGFFSSFKH